MLAAQQEAVLHEDLVVHVEAPRVVHAAGGGLAQNNKKQSAPLRERSLAGESCSNATGVRQETPMPLQELLQR